MGTRTKQLVYTHRWAPEPTSINEPMCGQQRSQLGCAQRRASEPEQVTGNRWSPRPYAHCCRGSADCTCRMEYKYKSPTSVCVKVTLFSWGTVSRHLAANVFVCLCKISQPESKKTSYCLTIEQELKIKISSKSTIHIIIPSENLKCSKKGQNQ
jgi:hypothetical protein